MNKACATKGRGEQRNAPRSDRERENRSTERQIFLIAANRR